MSTTTEKFVKIKIHEIDKTTPLGGGIDSTDIAFVPGFSITTTAATANIPVLCTTIKEFEAAFGEKPYILTENDVKNYSVYGFAKDDKDPSYVYAKELINQGMAVLYCSLVQENATSKLDAFYSEKAVIKTVLSTELEESTITDKGAYSVKYLTSGGYPSVVAKKETDNGVEKVTFEDKFAAELIEAAEFRGDAVALIDYQKDQKTSAIDFHSKMSALFTDKTKKYALEYATAMYPWANYNCVTLGDVVALPGSFAYLMCVAKAIKTSPNWLAMAGVSRGIVPKISDLICPNKNISNTLAEKMQPKDGSEKGYTMAINCITNIRPYGLTLWGNRTLKVVDEEGTVALNFLNTRNMVSDIKKLLYTTAKTLMFEQNSESLWLRFKDSISPLLDQLKMGNGISDYKIIKSNTTFDKAPVDRNELAAIVRIYPLYAVEYFDLTVEINDDVTVE